jgi:spectrin beta
MSQVDIFTFLTTIIITDDIEELAIMKHRFDSFEHEMNANASKVAVVNQLARQLLQVEHPNAKTFNMLIQP